KMQIRTALAGVSAAPIYLRCEPAAVRKFDGCRSANSRTAVEIRARMSGTLLKCRRPALDRQNQMQSEEGSPGSAFILVQVRIAPLTGDDEVEASVAVHICHGQPPSD